LHQWFIGYLVAIVLQLLASLIIVLFITGYPTFRFIEALSILALLLVALGWGLLPGIVSTLFGALLLVLLAIPPMNSMALNKEEDVIGVALYVVIGVAVSMIASQVRRGHEDAVKARNEAEEARWRVESLLEEREQVDRALAEAEREARDRAGDLEAIFEALTDPIFIVDKELGPHRINRAARQLLGIPEDVSIGKFYNQGAPLFDLFDVQGKLLSQEEWPQAAIFSGEVFQGDRAIDVMIHTHDGRTLFLNVTGAPIHGEDGEVRSALLACRDVTERRSLEQQTRESLHSLLVLAEALVSLPARSQETSEQQGNVDASEGDVATRLVDLIRSVLDCKRVSITIVDEETGELRSLAAMGLTPEQEQVWRERRPGFSLSDQVSGELLEEQFVLGNVVIMDMRQAPYNMRPNPYGVSTILLAPMRVDTKLVGILALDYGGELHNYSENELMLAKAVAELAALILQRERLLDERAENQANVLALQEASRLKDEFIGIAGHELRTPLTAIKGSVQLARRQLARVFSQEVLFSPESGKALMVIQNLLDRTERQVGMQNRLVSDLLDVSRIEAGRLELQLALNDLVPLVREVVEDQQTITPERAILLKNEVDGALHVVVDADRVRQVVTNYLSNALKYSDADEPVVVGIEAGSMSACVWVHDEGPGLSEEQQQRIWERFYRVAGIEVRSGSGVGLGLGLHISRMIIERHGGSVGVDSRAGEGSTFWFTLPLAEQSVVDGEGQQHDEQKHI